MYGVMGVKVPDGHRLDIEYDPDDGMVGGLIHVNGNLCSFQATLAPEAYLLVEGWLGLASCTYTAAGSLIQADGIGGDHPDREIWGIMGGVTTTQNLDGAVGSAQPAGNGVIRAGGYLNGSISPTEPDLDDPWPDVRTWLRWYRGASSRPWYTSADLLKLDIQIVGLSDYAAEATQEERKEKELAEECPGGIVGVSDDPEERLTIKLPALPTALLDFVPTPPTPALECLPLPLLRWPEPSFISAS